MAGVARGASLTTVFVGHYGVSLAAKRWAPRLSLGWLFLAVQALDLLFATFVLAGVEKMAIVPGFTAYNPYDLFFMPYSHSLLGALGWSVVVALVARGLLGRKGAAAAIALGAAAAIVPLLATGAFDTRPRELVPIAGILIGGAMVATSVTGRRLIDRAREDRAGVEARLALGASVPEALAPTVRQAVTTAMIPILDQTKNVGLVTLPGTFVGLILGGASPAEAARVQLTVLLALLAVELVAALAAARLTVAGLRAPGERVVIRP